MCDVSLKNLVLDQLVIPWLKIFFILITYLRDIVLTLKGEILSWPFMEVKRLRFKENKMNSFPGNQSVSDSLCGTTRKLGDTM